ncbi:RNA-binding protein [Verrucomicrobiaceae bacterium N1E253]|uniref:RNA-binding protein n=1 Tax=Oceaniferula marina TaxID=2748318 RepID=A0A851GEQ7_9BACT|nr:RNA-binding protein [Oceaniferula marina]NWK55669.1 RNA-binding protein [Oceaniferula marina]
MNIYVGNLSWGLSQHDLQQLFAEYGPVVNANLIEDRETGRSKGFGFVEMENTEDGERAIEALNGHEVDGRALTVNVARPREERPPRRNFDRQDNRRGNDRRGNDRRNNW